MQVDAHKSAVALFERYAKGGDNSKLEDLAAKTLPIFSTILRERK
jgi:putative membrane protein